MIPNHPQHSHVAATQLNKAGGVWKKQKTSVQSSASWRGMDGCVNTTGSVFYSRRSSPSILGLQVIDHGRLNIM